MDSSTKHSIISIPGNRKKDSCVQVLQVHKTSINEDQEDDCLPDGIYVCHALLQQTLKEEMWINQHIDAVLVGPGCSLSEIVAIRKITNQKVIPLIYHTLKYDWRAKEIALESGVDEYHIGFLDHQFVKRIRLIKRVKSLLNDAPANKKVDRPLVAGKFSFRLLKRSFDFAIAAVIILSLLPLLFIIVPLLMLETKGPVLTSTRRVGRNYEIFNLYKFRSFGAGDDKKVLLVWQFLRKAHLVGLPQMLNVLAGDMSFVGNYPIHEDDAEKLTKDEIARRFLAPAGIVGLWRFNHDGKIRAQDCTNQDVEYAMANSMWLDLKILFFHFLNLITGHHRKEWMFSSTDKGISTFSKQPIFNVAAN